tara:strand:+ start:31 stop:429 length:399 start_codon:yes stop_codon:yes gene_type:complete
MKEKEIMNKLFTENGLDKEHVFSHKHYTIITRAGIDLIQAKKSIFIDYEVVRCEPNFSVLKATAVMGSKRIITFGSALKGSSYNDGNTSQWYVIETAEKRAMSRAVLKLAGLYGLQDVYGEDEADVFKQSNN